MHDKRTADERRQAEAVDFSQALALVLEGRVALGSHYLIQAPPLAGTKAPDKGKGEGQKCAGKNCR